MSLIKQCIDICADVIVSFDIFTVLGTHSYDSLALYCMPEYIKCCFYACVTRQGTSSCSDTNITMLIQCFLSLSSVMAQDRFDPKMHWLQFTQRNKKMVCFSQLIGQRM